MPALPLPASMRSRAAILLFGTAVTAVFAASSVSAQESWPMGGRDPAHTATAAGPEPPYRVVWQLEGGTAPVTGVSATDRAVVVVTAEGIRALDPAGGAVLWERGRSSGPAGVPAIAGNLVIHARDEGVSGQLVARDIETGEIAWQASLGSAATGGPTVQDRTVFVGTLTGRLFALDLETGEERWRFQSLGGIAGAPAVSEGVVVAASYQPSTGRTTVYGLDAEAGPEHGPLWRNEAGPGGPPSAPSIAGGLVAIGLGDLQVRALDLEEGIERWSFTSRDGFGPRQIPAAGDALIVADRTHLYRLDPVSGEERWTWLLADLSPVAGNRVETLLSSSPAVSGTTALVGSATGQLSAIDVGSGRRVWMRDLGDGPVGPVAVTSGTVYAVTLGDAGSLMALEHDRDGTLLEEISPTVLLVGEAIINFAQAAAAAGLAIWLLFAVALRPRVRESP